MDLDTIIYIVITIVFLALGAKKKKKPVQAAAPEQVYENDDSVKIDEAIPDPIRDLFADYLPKSEPVAPPKIESIEYSESIESNLPKYEIIDVIEPPSAPIDTPESVVEDKYGFIDHFSQEGLQSIVDYEYHDVIKESEIGDEHAEQIRNPIIGEIIKDFDMRKAIIYAEIIKPKYQ